MAWYSEEAAQELKRKVAEESARFANGRGNSLSDQQPSFLGRHYGTRNVIWTKSKNRNRASCETRRYRMQNLLQHYVMGDYHVQKSHFVQNRQQMLLKI